VAVCRCGAEVPETAGDLPDSLDSPGRGFSAVNLVVGAVLLGAVAGAGYWVTRPAAPQATPEAIRNVPVEGGALPSPAPSDSTPSPERRAWEAELAKANAAPPAPETPVTANLATAPNPVTAASLEDVVGRVMPAVVLVEASGGRGSAFFVLPDTLITNVHVVKDDAVVQLRRMNGATISARVESKAPGFDIAILRVTPVAGQAVIPMGSARTLRPGQEVITIGSALGTLQNSVTRGIVSGVRQAGDATLVQTDAAANPGNSGGPLLDRNGVAIGITTMGYREQQGLNFAVAIDHASDILAGRVTSTSTAPLALNEVKPAGTARPSEAERVLAEGQRAFQATVTRVARAADALDGEWQRFRGACYSATLPQSYSHEWFVVLTPRGVTPAQVGGTCSSFLEAFRKQAARLGAEMRSALEAARRAGVLPGEVRDALRTNRLEFDGWDR
jgi:S1-C subfamily serine protease